MSASPTLLTERLPGIGHNRPPEPVDALAALDIRLAQTYREMVVRFADLELGCARVPDPLTSEADAATATDFIAQCQSQIKAAEVAHKQEKEFFLKAGRTVDGFFKRRCQSLAKALAGPTLRLKAYRDRIAAAEARRHEEERVMHESAAREALAEEAQLRGEAQQLLSNDGSPVDRRLAAEKLLLADTAGQRAAAAQRAAATEPGLIQIRGDYGSTAYVRRSWTFAVVDLDAVPREYMSLDNEVVREAINKDGVRDIPGLRIYQDETLHVRGAA